MSKKEDENKSSKGIERRMQQSEVKADKAAEETKRKAKRAKPQRRSHETRHEFH